MNPARSLGPALVSGRLQDLWIYIVAPLLGAGLAVAAWKIVAGGNQELDRGPSEKTTNIAEPRG